MSTQTEEKPPVDVKNIEAVFDRIMEKDPNIKIDINPNKEAEDKAAAEKAEAEKIEAEKQKIVEPKPGSEKKDDDFPESLPNEGRNEKWKAFRKAHEETKKELSTLKNQLADFEGTRTERDTLKAKISEYEAQVAELRKVDSISKLENDPEFQREYVQKEKAATDKITELAGYADIDPKEIMAAMNKPPKERYAALDDALSGATPTLAGKIRTEIDRIESIQTARAEKLSDAQASIEKLKQQRAISQEQESKKQDQLTEISFKSTAAQLGKELGLDEETITKAREFALKNDDVTEAHRVILRAFALDKLTGSAKEKDAKIAELESELAKFKESNPNLSSGLHGGSAKVDDGLSFVDAIKKGIKNLNVH